MVWGDAFVDGIKKPPAARLFSLTQRNRDEILGEIEALFEC